MLYSLTLHLKARWKYLQEVFFLLSWGQFCSCTRTKPVCRRWKPRPSYRSCHHNSKKATLLSAFLTWSQFPSILALLLGPGLRQQLGADEAKKKKKKKTSQVKFKDVFLLEARPCCCKPRETFSCSTFFMVSLRVSSLPSSLHGYLLLHWLQTTTSRASVKTSPAPPPKALHGWCWMDGSDYGDLAAWTAWPQISLTTLYK